MSSITEEDPIPVPAIAQSSTANESGGEVPPRVPEGDQAAPSLNGANTPAGAVPADPSLPPVKKLPDWR